jgi:hypothetical protein
MSKVNTAKLAEYQVMTWFMEAGWELYTPVADLHAVDLVVRNPENRLFAAIQIKHKQPDALNLGQLNNPWAGTKPPFDFLIFYVPHEHRGVIVPRADLEKEGKMFLFFADDADGYPTGKVRPRYARFGFDLRDQPGNEWSHAFVRHFAEVWRNAERQIAPPAGPPPVYPDFVERARRIWGDNPPGTPVSQIVSEMRD